MPSSCLLLPMPSPYLPSASQDDVRRQDPPLGPGCQLAARLHAPGPGRVGLNNDDAGAFVLPQLEVQKICTCVVVWVCFSPSLLSPSFPVC